MKRDPALIPLSHDHHHALSRARKLRRAATADAPTALVEAQAFLAFFDAETARHFEQEERFVFPLLGSAHPFVRRALGDHATIQALVANLRLAVASGAVDSGDLVLLAGALEGHIRFEERELFEEVQRHADASAMASVARHLDPPAEPRGTPRGR